MRWADVRFAVAMAVAGLVSGAGAAAPAQQARPGSKVAPKDLPPEIPAAKFEFLHGMIKPRKGAECLWLEIPWLTSVHEARERAVREGKPLLLWKAANGHPLGST